MPYIGTPPPRYAKWILTTQSGSDIGPTGRLVRRSGPILIIWFDIDADGASIGDGPVHTCWNSRKHRFCKYISSPLLPIDPNYLLQTSIPIRGRRLVLLV